ncbi:ATP-binding protein [Streptantibioticus parmotrematis]|uniref:ATP-binding protein n=1 Tax=Streptantibioticus parmotrematis TaxID=2873249 RepID=UPI0033EFF589
MLTVDSTRAGIAEARDAAEAYLGEACPWADHGAVVLVASELITNAVRHAGGWWRMRLHAGDGLLTMEVEDASPLPPRPRTPQLDGGGGLGWHLVRRLAGRVEVRTGAAGKVVRVSWTAPAPATL